MAPARLRAPNLPKRLHGYGSKPLFVGRTSSRSLHLAWEFKPDRCSRTGILPVPKADAAMILQTDCANSQFHQRVGYLQTVRDRLEAYPTYAVIPSVVSSPASPRLRAQGLVELVLPKVLKMHLLQVFGHVPSSCARESLCACHKFLGSERSLVILSGRITK